MRRAVCFLLCAVLVGLVAARMALLEPVTTGGTAAEKEQDIVTDWDTQRYNALPLQLPVSTQTAGSALIAEMDRYYLSRTPTEKNASTGALAGKNLILILAEQWRPAPPDPDMAPALYRLWSEGLQCGQVYAPEWYQGSEGRKFALLAGITPTTVWGRSALAWMGEQDTYLPFALARSLAQTGYICRAYYRGGTEAAYEALGFTTAEKTLAADLETLDATLPVVMTASPFFAYYEWEAADGEEALARLLQSLTEAGHGEDTAVCLVTGGTEELRGQLYLWGVGLAAGEVTAPCSELDVTPTLLNLLGVGFDARFLSGRDILSGAESLVSLYGSAYGGWVTDAGYYDAAEDAFFRETDRMAGEQEAAGYIRRMRRQVYDSYVYARRIMENNYFHVVMGR